MREQSSRAYGQRGAALFIVLMFAAVLSGLAAVAMRSSMSGARAAALYADVMQADELGRATADLVAHYVETGGPERRRGGGFEVRLHKVNIAIDYVSESGRVDANEAPLELIGALLAAAGASSSEVEAIEAGIVRFRSQKKPAAATPGTAAPGQRTANPPDTVAVRVPEPEDGGAASLSGGSAPLIQHRNLIAQAWDLPPALAQGSSSVPHCRQPVSESRPRPGRQTRACGLAGRRPRPGGRLYTTARAGLLQRRVGPGPHTLPGPRLRQLFRRIRLSRLGPGHGGGPVPEALRGGAPSVGPSRAAPRCSILATADLIIPWRC